VTRWRPAGDAALLLQAEGLAARLAAAILPVRPEGVLDVVPGAGTVLVITQPGSLDLAELAERLLALPLTPASRANAALTEIPVVYDGPDLDEVARLTGLPPGEVVARHLAAEYTVGWLGFSPGFGYLTGLDPVLASVPRMAEPRLRVPAGAVAIAGGFAGVYSSTSPGGWRLLGRTSAALWDTDRDPPAMLTPGMRVRFRQVDALPDVASPPSAPPAPSTPDRSSDVHDRGASHAYIAPHAPRSWTGGSAIEVIKPGPLATVQDLGRPGYGHLGVPHSGAADAASLRLANRLVGNADGAAGIELTFGRAAFRFPAGAWVAVTGASAPVTLETGQAGDAPVTAGGAPGRGSGTARDMPRDAEFSIPAGGVVRVGAPAAGLRSYLAVRGGIGVPPVLGSRSTDLRSGLGPAALRPGDALPVGVAAEPGPAAGAGGHAAETTALPVADAAAMVAPTVMPVAGEPAVLRVVPGPRDDWFEPDALRQLCAGTYVVTPASDRTGLRLDGPALVSARSDQLPSEGVATGALQVPPSGRPILLLADHPVTGGYPVIATVLSADIGLAAQLRPGSKVRFALATQGR
jgi:KipI family sensor histidine kinase inhibitor